MLEHGISEDAASILNSRMEDLKTDWTRLCEKLENVNIEVKETVDYWKRYIEVRTPPLLYPANVAVDFYTCEQVLWVGACGAANPTPEISTT